MKRIDYLEAAKMLQKKGIVANDATMLLASTYATGWREGTIQMSWEDWLQEDVALDDDEDDEKQGEGADPTELEPEAPSPISSTRWPSSVSSTDSAQQPTGT